jgi:hypothetical protein
MRRAITEGLIGALILMAGLFLVTGCQPNGDGAATREGAGWTDGADPARLGDERAGESITERERAR